MLDDRAATGIERGKGLLRIARQHGLDGCAGVLVGLPDDLVEHERWHTGFLELAERSARLNAAELGNVADQDEPSLGGIGKGELAFGIASGEHGSFINNPRLARSAGHSRRCGQQTRDGDWLGIDSSAKNIGG